VARIFGFDIGTTSIGFAVIDHDPETATGSIRRLGVRIFPEARDPDGTPLNQTRRQKRMVRRQLRRRRVRRRLLNETLSEAGLLPDFNSPDWAVVMGAEPYGLRKRGISEALTAHEVGRAIYHLAQQRHFKGRDLEETDEKEEEAADEKAATNERESTLRALKTEKVTLGAWLADRPPDKRKRGVHAHRDVVKDEFARLWTTQAAHHAILRDDGFRERIEDAIFAQRPVFWRKSTLGQCRFMPGEELCPKGSWLSGQRRMLEKLNNLALATGNLRPLDSEERAAILTQLRNQGSMSWGAVRTALKPLFKRRGEEVGERSLRFNLEVGGDPTLLGNGIEARLAGIFGDAWDRHPRKQAIRDIVPQRLWSADYGEVGEQRVVILSSQQRKANREAAAREFIADFGATPEQARKLQEMSFPSGWEPYSTKALQALMPHLEAGVKFGALVNGPDWAAWRNETFPDRDQPTGEFLDRLPSPANKEERERIATLRNPTVVRTQNELRKVVNNLIGMFGKPDLIRVELARDVGKSKTEREDIKAAIRKQEGRRKAAIKDLESNGIAQPSHQDVEKWMLWKEGSDRCPYTGDQIGFDALFREGRYEVEHIWPRSRSLDDSFKNKTLCRKDINIAKGNKTPYEYFLNDPDKWAAIQNRLQGMAATKGGFGMSRGKIKRFLAERMPEDFASRQLNDTGYAARQAVAMLRRLWPDIGPEARVTVQAVTGRVTAQLRKLWELNNILGENGEKTRADHRHHAVDALTVACTHPGMTNKLSRYLADKDDPRAERPHLPPPWDNIRADAEQAVATIVVSHRVRKKVSGPLHKETTYGDTGEDVTTKTGTYRQFVTRKRVEALTKGELADIRDDQVRKIVSAAAAARGGDPKKAFPPYPRVSEDGPEIRKVRLLSKQQLSLMAPVSTGYADLGKNHHVAMYRLPNGKPDFDVVSLFEVSRRLAKREPIVRRSRDNGAEFIMSLSAGDAIRFAKEEGQPATLWHVQKIASKGQISLLSLTDASKEEKSLFEPMVGGILSRNAEKLSIDPIGRIRVAND
jgi:CRISPR-associated endonuclease Csn1